MLAHVLFISLTGVLVVFGFLFIMFLILASFRKLFYEKEETKSITKTVKKDRNIKTESELKKSVDIKGDIPAEVVAVIMSSLNHYENQNLNAKEISIKKRG
ncbi:MAG: OadG family protein [Bacillota bacterium]